jgi:hypothetical protein
MLQIVCILFYGTAWRAIPCLLRRFFTCFELHIDWRSFKVFQSCALISNGLAMSLVSQKINALFKLTRKRVNLCYEAVEDQQRRDKPDEHSVNGAPNAALMLN